MRKSFRSGECVAAAGRFWELSTYLSNSLNFSDIQLGISLATGFLSLSHPILPPSTSVDSLDPPTQPTSGLRVWAASGEHSCNRDFFVPYPAPPSPPFCLWGLWSPARGPALVWGYLSRVVSVWPPGWLVLGMECRPPIAT